MIFVSLLLSMFFFPVFSCSHFLLALLLCITEHHSNNVSKAVKKKKHICGRCTVGGGV
jgi:hypothetical protein